MWKCHTSSEQIHNFLIYREAKDDKKWYKFDDGEVSECRMGDDEEMKIQCFGGDYMGEVFDPMLKRTSYRKQKRWWNAYMLFYTREDVEESALIKSLDELSLSKSIFSSKSVNKMQYFNIKQKYFTTEYYIIL